MPTYATRDRKPKSATWSPHEEASRRIDGRLERGESPGPIKVKPLTVAADDARGIVVDADVAGIRDHVSNALLYELATRGPGRVPDVIQWIQPYLVPGLDQPWKQVQQLALGEAQQKFAMFNTSGEGWQFAVTLRAFAALLERVTDRLLIDIGWVRSRLADGADPRALRAKLIARHRGILLGELGAVWPMLMEFYDQGDSDDPLRLPTRAEFVDTSVPPKVREHDRRNPVKRLSAKKTQNGFPPVPTAPHGVIQ